ncbi:helix-turn-helix domain-containing protein [Streptomyces sp. NPDC048106]|uniref:helix-turn-helix domain-containing protein n=1 Tax=Streptomyces sp. NPDC048106 TaxID=3155750 RepID=UPI003454DC66
MPPPPPQQAESASSKTPDPALDPHTGAEQWLITRARERYQAVQDLLAQGWTISAIGRELGLARHTARRYARCENPEALPDRANQGCTNASARFHEIQAQGHPGRTPQAVRRFLRPPRDTAKAARTPPPKPQDLTNWITRHPGRLRAEDADPADDAPPDRPRRRSARPRVAAPETTWRAEAGVRSCSGPYRVGLLRYEHARAGDSAAAPRTISLSPGSSVEPDGWRCLGWCPPNSVKATPAYPDGKGRGRPLPQPRGHFSSRVTGA